MDTNVSNCPIHGGRIRGIRFGEVPRIVYGCLWRHLLGHVVLILTVVEPLGKCHGVDRPFRALVASHRLVAHLALATAAPKAPSRWEAAEQEESPRAYIKVVNATVQQQESKALTRVRSQIRVPAISSGRAGTACRFNGYDERCRVHAYATPALTHERPPADGSAAC
jgi:hypothetical protein